MEQINLICCERAVINCSDVSRSNSVQSAEANVSPRDNLNLFLLLIKEYFFYPAVVTTRRLHLMSRVIRNMFGLLFPELIIEMT